MNAIFPRESGSAVAGLGLATLLSLLAAACSSDSKTSNVNDGGSTGSVASAGGTVGVSSGGSASGAGGAVPAPGGTSAAGGANTSGGAPADDGGLAGAGNHGNAGSLDAGGAANGGATNGGASNGGAAGAGGVAAFVNPAPGSKFFVGANFWNIDWEGQGDFFQSNVDFKTVTNPWRAELLSDLAPYHVLRFMDWNQTNNSNNAQAVWTTRKQKTAAQSEPVAFEWQMDLCNRAKKDYWLNVPHEATPDYWMKLANLVHDELDPSLRVYVEWSNEVWNTGFPQNAYAVDKAKGVNITGDNAAAGYYVYASVRMYEAFEAVFGKDSPRLVKVLAGQAAWTGPCDAHVAALKDPNINPKGTQPTVYAIAPYFGGKSIAELSSALATVNQWTSSSLACATGGKLPLISYEGGSDSFSAGSGCTTLQHDPGMHDLYTSYFTGISGAGLKGPFMQYTHTGSCWGLKEKTSDTVDVSPKYKGVLDWLAAHP